MKQFVPNQSISDASLLDRRSIQLLKSILPDTLIDGSQLQEGGTLANIDGYLDILSPDRYAVGKVFVQVKHLTFPEKDGVVFYDIPKSIYAYADLHKGEVVLFIACDERSRKFYWRNIDSVAIKEFLSGSATVRNTARYYFLQSEKCSESNVEETIASWKKLYDRKMETIKDERDLAESFATCQRKCFNSISTRLHGLADFHIERSQVKDIFQWIHNNTGADEKRICLLVGDAGVGKSGVLKDLLTSDVSENCKYLCIKADYIDDNGNLVTLEKLHDTLAYYSVDAEKVVLVVDQIDALSQSLANDRKHLNMLMTIFSSLKDWSNVRAVVSCRKYDLEYDAVLNSLKDNATIIEIGELADSEVKMALEKLHDGLSEKIDSVTFKLLKNLQMLDSFSLLYQRNKSKISFCNQIEVYDALWDSVICDSECRLDVENREEVMYKIADTVQKAETLNPQFSPNSRLKQAYDYLASNGLIKRTDRTVSFFHQSFYEYTLARNYSEKNRVFATDIKRDVQGLEIRSTVKAVLDFKRGHDLSLFVKETRSILEDPDIRFHLKLLALSVLTFVEQPSRDEKQIVIAASKDERMLDYFLRGVDAERWFPTVRALLKGMMPELVKSDKLFFHVISCLSRYAFRKPEEVYEMLDLIRDQESKLWAYSYVLRAHNDYSHVCVIHAYNSIRVQDMFLKVTLLQDAVQTNLNFALNETEKLLLDYLLAEEPSSKHDGYELVDVLCAKLSSEYPLEMLQVFHRSICNVVRQTSYPVFHDLTVTKVFDGCVLDHSIEKLLDMYENLLSDLSQNIDVVKPLVSELLSLNNETTISMAFLGMASNPKMYDNEIISLLKGKGYLEKYMHGNIKYYFLHMLKAWYGILDVGNAVRYQRWLLEYESEYDYKPEVERKWVSFLYPYLWRDKWMLICNTLDTEHLLIPEMRKCSQELLRRFGKKILVERPSRGIGVTFGCGGVVTEDAYKKWSLVSWLNSFLKLNEGHRYVHGEYDPIDLRIHAEAFKKCVAADVVKYYDFILDFFPRKDVPQRYKIAGVCGLLEGGMEPNSLWRLVEQFMTDQFAKEDSYVFSQMAEYYIKEENSHLTGIMNLCERICLLPFEKIDRSNSDDSEMNEVKKKTNEMLTTAINSPQGHAAEVLVKMCRILSVRSHIYNFFTLNSSRIYACVKMIPLYYLDHTDYYDENLYLPMMKVFLEDLGPEALFLRPNVIQWCFYHRTESVRDYIDRVEVIGGTHELLVQIYFYGMAGQKNAGECRKRFDNILSRNEEEVIAKVVEIAMKSYGTAEYRDLSVEILERFADDGREKVTEAYCFYCDSLPVEAFPWYYSVIMASGSKRHREICSQLDYVKKCLASYPVLCYKFISKLESSMENEVGLLDSEYVKILLEIYKKLSQDEDTDSINELLDIFDDYIFRNDRTIIDAVSLVS